MKDKIKFEEYLNDDFEWKEQDYLDSSDWDNVRIDDTYTNYILYWCSDENGDKVIFRNKKKKVCEHCGSELE